MINVCVGDGKRKAGTRRGEPTATVAKLSLGPVLAALTVGKSDVDRY